MARTWPAAALLLLLAAPLAPAQDALPPGCARTAAGYRCEFEAPLDPVAGALLVPDVPTNEDTYATFDLPVFDRTLATFTVVHDGADGGWDLEVQALVDGTWVSYSNGTHARSDPGAPGAPHAQTTLHVLERFPGAPHRINVQPFGSLPNPTPSPGDFRVLYEGERVREGTPWPRPAATRDDPHLPDAAGDASDPGLDVTAFWFDDAFEGDGLFEAHLALADHERGRVSGELRAAFRVGGHDYTLVFIQAGGNEVCAVGRGRIGDAESSSAHRSIRPACTFDAAADVLTARIPERALGNPGVGVPFEGLRAVALRHVHEGVQDNLPPGSVWDVADQPSYAFALGGPRVWDELNPRLAVPPEPWYAHPLAADNLADTLQIAGALAATSAFLGGLVLVRRRRARVRRLLDEVDAVARAHESDADAGLRALGRLESALDARYRAGRLHENEYQLASQRIATAATRLARRRDLGLDDGTPRRG